MSGSIRIRKMVSRGRTMANGTNDEYYEFDEQAISATLEVIRQQPEGADLRAEPDFSATAGGEAELRDACIEVATSNNQVCLNLPLGIGNVCLPVPFDLPDGSLVRACLSIRYRKIAFIKIPTGVCIEIYFAGERIVRQCFP